MILISIPIAYAVYLKLKYKQIGFLFVLLIAIGIMQGLCDNTAFILGNDKINWGIIKAVIIFIIFFVTVFNKTALKTRLPVSFIVWSCSYISLCLVIAWHIFEAANSSYDISSSNVMQNYSLLNMLMAFVAYFKFKDHTANTVMNMLTAIGIFVSVIAIIQWLIFKTYENSILLTLASRAFGRLDENSGGGIRVFSVFISHYGLSAFLCIVTILYATRSIYGSCKLNYTTIFLFVFAQLITFNLTSIFLTFIGCLISYMTHMYSFNMSFNYLYKTMKRAFFVLILFLSTIIIFKDFRTRISGIGNYSETSTGAGNSLYLRNQFIINQLQLLSSNLNGIGLSLTDTSKDSYGDDGYVRTGVTADFFTADAWLLWLIVQIGLFFGLLLLYVFFSPLFIAIFLLINGTISNTWTVCASMSLLFIVLLGSMSNSPILNYPPSNVIIWCAVGVIFAAVSRNQAGLPRYYEQ